MQSAGQEMPAGLLVTVPLPVTVTDRVRRATNVAVTERFWVIATLQAPVPVQAPDQPVNAKPAAGVAVSATSVASG